LVYGLPNFKRQNSENVIADRWGFEFFAIANCDVSEEIENRADSNNNIVEPLIAAKHGKDWRDKFEKAVDTELERENIALSKLESFAPIVKKQKEMEKEGNGLQYYPWPVANEKNEYNVSVEGWGKLNNKYVWSSFYRFRANCINGSYKLISDTLIFQHYE